MPYAFITDQITQFDNEEFEEYCIRSDIQKFHSAPGYPQRNGHTEITNKILLDGLKKKLDEAKRKWINELHSVLWAYRTTPRTIMGEIPYMLAFGTKEVVLVEIGLLTHTVLNFD